MRERLGNILWGLLFIFVGIGFTGNVLFDWEFSLFFEGWWTLFIIVPCGISMVQNGFRTGNIIGLSIGVLLYLSDRLDSNLFGELIGPVILILFGCSLILKNGLFSKRYLIQEKTIDFGDLVNLAAVGGSRSEAFQSIEFPGGELKAVFGGVTLDLHDAIVTRDIVINCTAVFGGIDIMVPNTAQIKISGTPIFGGIKNETRNNPSAEHVIYINVICMFGGVTIK